MMIFCQVKVLCVKQLPYGGGLNREGGLNKYLHLKRGLIREREAYWRGG